MFSINFRFPSSTIASNKTVVAPKIPIHFRGSVKEEDSGDEFIHRERCDTSPLSEPPDEIVNPFAESSKKRKRTVDDDGAREKEKEEFSQWIKDHPEFRFPYKIWKNLNPKTLITKSLGQKVVAKARPKECAGPSKARENAEQFIATITKPDDPFWREKLGTETLKILKTLYNARHPRDKHVSLNTSTDLEVNKAVRLHNSDPTKPHIGSGAISGNKTEKSLQYKVLDYILGEGKKDSRQTLEIDLPKRDLVM